MCLGKEEGDLQISVKYQNHNKSPLILCFLIRKSMYGQLSCERMDFIVYLSARKLSWRQEVLLSEEKSFNCFQVINIESFFHTFKERFPRGLFCCICTLENRHRHVQWNLTFYFSSQTLNNEKLGSDELRHKQWIWKLILNSVFFLFLKMCPFHV